MKKVNIGLFRRIRRKGAPHLVSLCPYDYEGPELQKLIIVIEDSLKRDFPGIEVNKLPAVKELLQGG